MLKTGDNVLEFVPFKFEHLKYIKPHAVQSEEWALLLAGDASEVLATGPALSMWQSGVCLGAAGLVVHWPGRAEAWAMFADKIGFRPMLEAVRCMRRVIDTSGFRRVDMTVRNGNIHGHVLASAVGFDFEAKLEAYHPSGDDVFLYKKVKRQ